MTMNLGSVFFVGERGGRGHEEVLFLLLLGIVQCVQCVERDVGVQ